MNLLKMTLKSIGLASSVCAFALGQVSEEEPVRPTSRPDEPRSTSRLLDVLSTVETERATKDVTLSEVATAVSRQLSTIDERRIRDLLAKQKSAEAEHARLVSMLEELQTGLPPDFSAWRPRVGESEAIDPSLLEKETRQTLKTRGDLERRRNDLERRLQAPPDPRPKTEPITPFNSALLEVNVTIPEAPVVAKEALEDRGPGPFAIRLAHAAFLGGDWATAVRNYKSAKAEDLTLAQRWELARSHEELGQLEESVAVLGSLITDAKDDEFWVRRASTLKAYLEKEVGIRGFLKK